MLPIKPLANPPPHEVTSIPRLYREAPVNSVQEGAGNIVCLDVPSAIDREPAALSALFAELDAYGNLPVGVDFDAIIGPAMH